MSCIEKIYSVSAVIGNGTCNGNCSFCAGRYLRPQVNSSSSYWKNYKAAIRLSARYGGWSLSLTGSGEPTCDPESITKALQYYDECAREGAYFPNVNLFTNGILFGDRSFCDKWLPKWKSLGLTNIAISIHSADNEKQAKVYGVSSYPMFDIIRQNIEMYGIGVRATLLLRNGEIDNVSSFSEAIDFLIFLGYNNITAWPVGNPDGSPNEYTPSGWNLMKIRWWLKRNAIFCHGHVWGGGVYDYNGNLIRITNYVTKHNPKKDYVRQLVVFQDGTVAYSWIREGALCMK
jgi:sulfatase maturation enzyme AslB (radical SAM superfamily)